jgi:hypothetical protein
MPRRAWLSLVTLATGVALMVVAQLAGAAPERKGGIFKVGTTGASVQIDPQLAYITTGWWLEYATAAKLYNYRPGGKLIPEVAPAKVSNGGKANVLSSQGSASATDSVTAASRTRSTDGQPRSRVARRQFITIRPGRHRGRGNKKAREPMSAYVRGNRSS